MRFVIFRAIAQCVVEGQGRFALIVPGQIEPEVAAKIGSPSTTWQGLAALLHSWPQGDLRMARESEESAKPRSNISPLVPAVKQHIVFSAQRVTEGQLHFSFDL